MTVQDGGYLEEMLRTKPDHVLLNIMRMPHLWIKWEPQTLEHLMNPDACRALQLLLHKKLEQLSDYRDEQIAKASLIIKQQQQEEEEQQ